MKEGKTLHFQAKDSEERERWIRALEETIARHNMMRGRSGKLGGGGGRRSDHLLKSDSDGLVFFV